MLASCFIQHGLDGCSFSAGDKTGIYWAILGRLWVGGWKEILPQFIRSFGSDQSFKVQIQTSPDKVRKKRKKNVPKIVFLIFMVIRCPVQLVHPFVVLLRSSLAELPFYMTIMATIMGHGVLNVAIKFIVVAFFHGTHCCLRRATLK